MPRGGHRGGWYSIRTGSGGSCRKYKQWDDIYTVDWVLWQKKKLPPHIEQQYPLSSLWSLQMQNAFPAAKHYYRNAGKLLKPVLKLATSSSSSVSCLNGRGERIKKYLLRTLEGGNLKKSRARSGLLNSTQAGEVDVVVHPMGQLMVDAMSGGGTTSSSGSVKVKDMTSEKRTAPPARDDFGTLQSRLDAIADFRTSADTRDRRALSKAPRDDDEQERTSGGDIKVSRLQIESASDKLATLSPPSDTFLMHNLHRALAQHELFWHDPRLIKQALGGGGDGRGGAAKAKGSQSGTSTQLNPVPYVDESSAAVTELHLSDILYLRHRTKSRHHPYWIEIEKVHKNWKRNYLHNLRVAKEEARTRVGVWKSERSSGMGGMLAELGAGGT
mmetsp:Transcript_10653/g.26068  ORF Transcript_10653/g.26068 Transcript_10653/m.26068 type:complete len:386 (-) Transcript_10653:111-1268(-)|eukprot:g15794.t1